MTQLTEAEIDALPAGPALNVLLARHLFNLEVYRTGDNAGPGGFTYIDRWGDGEDDWAEAFGPDYSGTWNGMGLVWEKMPEGKALDEAGGIFSARFHCEWGYEGWELGYYAVGPTAPVAVARAALKVVMLG